MSLRVLYCDRSEKTEPKDAGLVVSGNLSTRHHVGHVGLDQHERSCYLVPHERCSATNIDETRYRLGATQPKPDSVTQAGPECRVDVVLRTSGM